ncbi:OmpH family outer membrane protein [Roseomonas stagni]|uniref:OmpH family outer membrane protein n=1 Tax=Falsiroseomonas algicola TaxID=2716930 RepID=A0A6M1LTB3_9PROT|nr:OmpH family outer membrane protein [Falsiroseomonas algicola]NGM23748.1 OmpH family outer membrane protein [Falsiroseomonas algicola]
MRLRLLLSASLIALAVAPALPRHAAAQAQGQEWFVPGQGQQRPQGQPAQGQRPPQGQAQRPAAPAAGQRTPAPVIAIVDIPEVQRLSAAFNQVREEIERRRARLNEDLQREQARWREEQQSLAAARATLAPEQLRNRERELQDRITDAQRIFRDRSRAIDQAAQQGLQQIEQALGAVIRQVAASRGVNIVLPRPLVIFNESGFDLTDEISAQMNRVLRSVTMLPEAAAPIEPPPAAAAPAAPATPPAAPPARRN